MTLDVSANTIVSALIVAGLLSMARTTLSTARLLSVLTARVDDHDRRLDNRDLDDRQARGPR